MNSLPKTAKPQSLIRSIDKSLAAEESDIILEMLIKEARLREKQFEKRNKNRLGIVKLENSLPFIKIEDSSDESDSDRDPLSLLPKLESR